MALISHKHREVYVRVPRTGSSSFIKSLDAGWVSLGHIHCSARDISIPEGYHSFGFIRNPWDWLVSAYHIGWYMGCNGIKEVWPGNRMEPHDAPGMEYGQRTNMTFTEFLYLRKTTPMDWLCDGTGIVVDEVRRFEDMKLADWEQRGDHLPYRKYYTDETAEYVARKCYREVSVGGYEF